MLKLIRRLFSRAVSRSLLRRSSLVRRLFSLTLSRSLSICSSVKFRLLSLLLFCSLSRCSSVKLRLSSLFLSLSHFLCLSLSLYSKLEDIINKISKLRNCAVLNRYEKFLFLLSWLRWSFWLFMLHETRAAFCFRAKNYALTDYPKFCIGLPLVRTDGRSVGRSRDYQIFRDG